MRMMRVVNIIPANQSDETNDDSEPSIAVNPKKPNEMVITAFTNVGLAPPGPLYFSSDGGENWSLEFDLPGGNMTQDQTPSYAPSGKMYIGLSEGNSGDLDVLRTDNPTVFPDIILKSKPIDQPWIVATTVADGPDKGKDRLYVGVNDVDNSYVGVNNVGKGTSATVLICLDAGTEQNPKFTPVKLDPRNPPYNNAATIRPAVHPDGTVYVAYVSLKNRVIGPSGKFSDGSFSIGDIVVARDDNWGDNTSPFTALKDSTDGKTGCIVSQDAIIPEDLVSGVRRGSTLNIAIDPTNSNIVYIIWCDTIGILRGGTTPGPRVTPAMRLRRSLDRGVTWSGDLLVLQDVLLATLAINSKGTVALLYQKVVTGKMETHFTSSDDGILWVDDTLVARTDISTTIVGDFIRMDAVGEDFYGVFPAMNTPDSGNFFPNGGGTFRFQRNTSGKSLIGLDGTTRILPSVDPFFLKVQKIDDCSRAPHLTAISRLPDTLDVFWIGPEGAVWSHPWAKGYDHEQPFKISDPLDPTQSPNNRPVPASLNSPVSVVSRATRYQNYLTDFPGMHMDVFWIGVDGAIWWAWWDLDPGIFSNPRKIFDPYDPNLAQPVKARLNSPISALSRNKETIDIFWIGEDDAIWTIWLHNKTDWNPLPLKISGTVKVSKNSPLQALARFEDILNVFWVAQDGQIWSTWWGQSFNNGQWNPPITISEQGSPYGGNL